MTGPSDLNIYTQVKGIGKSLKQSEQDRRTQLALARCLYVHPDPHGRNITNVSKSQRDRSLEANANNSNEPTTTKCMLLPAVLRTTLSDKEVSTEGNGKQAWYL